METKNHSSSQNENIQTISRFECQASAGIGYAYWMHVEYKNPASNSTWDDKWQYSDRLGSVSVGKTSYIDLASVSNLKQGAKVRYHMEIKSSSKDQIASEEFVFVSDSQWQATYDGRGSLFSPRLEFKGCSSYKQPALKSPAIGFCRPIEQAKFLDHTYVQTGDTFYKCHGGVDNGKQICSGISDVMAADKIAKGQIFTVNGVKINDGNAGIMYGWTGVCHQISNRILFPAQVIVDKAAGYAVSSIIYGTYGAGKREVSNLQHNKDSYLHKLDALYLKFMQGDISENEYNSQDISMLFELKLGSGFTQKHSDIVAPAMKARKAIKEIQDTTQSLTEQEMADSVNAIAAELQRDYAELLSSEDYIALFDFEPENIIAIV